jgi:hypothetical protein
LHGSGKDGILSTKVGNMTIKELRAQPEQIQADLP